VICLEDLEMILAILFVLALRWLHAQVLEQFCDNNTHSPDVNRFMVMFFQQDHFWCTIRACRYMVREPPLIWLKLFLELTDLCAQLRLHFREVMLLLVRVLLFNVVMQTCDWVNYVAGLPSQTEITDFGCTVLRK